MTTQTTAVAALDVLVDRLVGEGKVVVYSLIRYDSGSDGKEFVGKTRIAHPAGIDPDPAVDRLILGYANLPTPNDLRSVIHQIRNAGWSAWQIGWLDPDDDDLVRTRHIPIRVVPGESHQELDILREILVAWHNARHDSRLVEVDPGEVLKAAEALAVIEREWPADRPPTADEVEAGR